MDDEQLLDIEAIGEDFRRRHANGEQPSIDIYVESFEGDQNELRAFLEVLLVLDKFKPELADAAQELIQTPSANREGMPRIPDFHLIREAGRGGMGVVYEAIQKSLSRRVAIKLLPQELLRSKTAIQRFRQEAKSAAGLHHSNIVPVFDVGFYERNYYYAMQFIDGKPLGEVICDIQTIRNSGIETDDDPNDGLGLARSFSSRYLLDPTTLKLDQTTTRQPQDREQKGPERDHDFSHDPPNGVSFGGSRPDSAPDILSQQWNGNSGKPISRTRRKHYFENVAAIGIQAASALDYAHKHGVIHRDIKPSNLMLDSGGNVWVADFGLAKTGDVDLTKTGDFVGTLRFMSPERFAGKCDARSDVYALGATLYELAVLQPIFDHDDKLKIVESIKHRNPIRPRAIDATLPRDLDTILVKSLAKEPDRRYQTAAEMADDLKRFIEGRVIHARKVSSPERLWIWGCRNPLVASLLSLLVIGSIATSIAFGIAATRFRDMAVTQTELTKNYQQEAKRSQQFSAEAFRNFQAARNIVDEFFTTVSESDVFLRDTPGNHRLRETLLAKARSYYVGFVAQRPTDELIASLARANHQLGRIDMMLGSLDSAQESLEEAEGSLRQLMHNGQASVADEIELAAVFQSLARLHEKQGDVQSKRSVLTSADELLNGVDAKVSPADLNTYLRAVASLKISLAKLALADVNVLAAWETVSEALRVNQVRQQSWPSAATLVSLADSHSLAGLIARRQGMSERAHEHYSQSIELGRQLIEIDPQSAESRLHQADLLTNYAIYRSVIGEHEQALALSQESRDLCQQIVDENPLVPDFRQALAIKQTRLAGQLIDFNLIDEAVEAGNRGIELRQALVERYPENFQYAKDLVESTRKFGRVLHEGGRLPEAITAFERAIASHEQVLAVFPKPQIRASLARVYQRLAYVHRDQGELKISLLLLLKAMSIRRALVQESPDDLMSRYLLAELLVDTGNMELMDDQTENARGSFVEARIIVGDLVDSEPLYETYRFSLSRIWHGLSNVERQAGSSASALNALNEAILNFDSLSDYGQSKEGARDYRSALDDELTAMLDESGK